MKKLRISIIEGKVNIFVKNFFTELYEKENSKGKTESDYPQWIKEALTAAGVDIEFMN